MANIFNIKPDYNFLESLVFWVLSNYPDPFYLTNITILLPSRRACRQIKKIFLEQSESSVLMLPNIKAIGDVDYDDLRFVGQLDEKPVSPLKYHLLLIKQIKQWNDKNHLFSKNITNGQISAIAANLESFLQEVEKEQLDLDNLQNIEAEELSEHKQQILNFLRHFGSNWQNILAKNNLISITRYRNQLIELNANYLHEYGLKHPVIIAGSTGSVKATAGLIKTISSSDKGYIVLSGLDHNLSDEVWQSLKEQHPQFMLKKLLNYLKIERKQVKDLEFEQFRNCSSQINLLTSYTFLPALQTVRWQHINDLKADSISHLKIIQTRDNFQEAKLISLIMRQTIEEKNKNAVLITNDQNLALTVKTELQKWNINIDDSKNNNLSNSQIVNYLLFIVELFANDFEYSNLLAILKHPITKAGFNQKYYQENLELLELKILRKTTIAQGFDYLQNEILQLNNYQLLEWFKQIYSAFEPLVNLFTISKNNNLKDLLAANISCAESLSKNDKGNITLYDLEAAEQFLEFTEDLLNETDDFIIENDSYLTIIKQLMSGYRFNKTDNFHPRLHILSTIEARLVNYDLVIISGLNDGEFPDRNFSQNWLNGKMRQDFGLPDFNQKTGVAAYDFCHYLANKEVIITRAQSKNNSLTLKSAFLLKLETVLKIVGLDSYLTDCDLYYKQLLSLLSKALPRVRIAAPTPKPAAQYRPQEVSVTDIGKWLKDPYYIYAKRVLKLKKLTAIANQPSFAEFGNFVHQVLEDFIKDYKNIRVQDRLKALLNYGKKSFKSYLGGKEAELLWMPKFINIAGWFIGICEKMTDNISFAEAKGQIVINNVTIITKIDRIDINYSQKQIIIIDYKTGSVPQNKAVEQGFEPQLALEAVILLHGNIINYSQLKEINSLTVKDLQYYELKGKDKNNIRQLSQKIDIEKLVNTAREEIGKLIAIFNDENSAYICCPDPDIYLENDYHYLARIDEWQ